MLKHGIQPLLYYSLRNSESLNEWPERIQKQLELEAKKQILIDILRQRELKQVLQTLASRKIVPLLMKGTPLSFTHYPDPSLRPRWDTDILIQKSDLQKTEATLLELGYTRSNTITGDLIQNQLLYSKEESGMKYFLDIHWKISNPTLFADLFSYRELLREIRIIPQLGKDACTVSPEHSLLLSCIHIAAHHSSSIRLIWLYDLHLLVEKMSVAEFEKFAELALQKKTASICNRYLTLSKLWFSTKSPGHLTEFCPGVELSQEPTAQYLDSNLTRAKQLLLDFRQLDLRRKVQLLRENLFPPAEYMRRRFSISEPALLPFFYFYRIVSGVRYWFQRQ